MSNIPQSNELNFDAEVLRSPIPVLVDFYATWCPPCRQIAPMLEELARDLAGAAKVVKVNVDDNQDLASAYRIESVPTLLVFKAGEIVERLEGVQQKGRLQAALTLG